jgi:hypothetical protein
MSEFQTIGHLADGREVVAYPIMTGSGMVYELRTDMFPGDRVICGHAYRHMTDLGCLDATDCVPSGKTVSAQDWTHDRVVHHHALLRDCLQ